MKKISAILLCLSLLTISFTPAAFANSEIDELAQKQKLINTSKGYTIKPTYPTALDISNFHLEAKPGDIITDEVYVKNFGETKRRFKLYGVDGKLNEKGKFTATLSTDNQKHIGLWTSFEKNEVELNPGEYTNVKFTIKIPEDAQNGFYQGAVVMEHLPESSSNNVMVSTRIALRAEITIRDHPLKVAQMAHRYFVPIANFWTTVFPKAYFWVSSSLLILSIILLVANQRKKGKK